MKKIILVSLLALVSLLIIPLVANASLNTNLYYGLQKNSDVTQLQEFLIDKGFLPGSSTGNFFSLTLKAVKAYQASQNINQTGYVGTLTRTAINNELASNLSASNQEATNETGTTPPAPNTPATTNDVIATLQAQIALLTQQLQAMQAQQTTVQQLQQAVQQQTQTIQQIQQNTQQIAQNTTPPPPVCNPNWQCGSWSACSNFQQTRTCTDSNNCGVSDLKPVGAQSCTMPLNISCSGVSDPIMKADSGCALVDFAVVATGGNGTYKYSWGGTGPIRYGGCDSEVQMIDGKPVIISVDERCFNGTNTYQYQSCYYDRSNVSNHKGETVTKRMWVLSGGGIAQADCSFIIPDLTQ